MNWPFILLAIIVFEQSGLASSDPNNTDLGLYQYKTDRGEKAWCVFCTEEDATSRDNHLETQCVGKNINETRVINGQKVVYWAVCTSLQTSHYYPRYIKNCSSAPKIDGAKVGCKDEHGNEFYRVHDTCSVMCTDRRMVASKSRTKCEPTTGTDVAWTDVRCKPKYCRPLSTKIESDENASCDVKIQLPLNTMCEVDCPYGYERRTKTLQCVEGEWKHISRCTTPLSEQWCPPLIGNITSKEEKSNCSTDKKLPVNTTCEVSCPAGYKPMTRVLKCKDGAWHVFETCAQLLLPDGQVHWGIPLSVVLAIIFLITIVVVICVCKRNRTGSSASSSSSGIESNGDEELSLISSPSVKSQQHGADSGINKSLSTCSSSPPDYQFAMADPIMEKGLMAAPPCSHNSHLEIHYKIDNAGLGQRLPESRILQIAPGTLLTLLAKCTKGHKILQFNHGPFFKDDDCQIFTSGISVRIMPGDEGAYFLCAKCDEGQEIFQYVTIILTDVTGNPEHTFVKQVATSREGLGSLDSTVTEPSITAASEPSKQLKTEPTSLPSNPQLCSLMDSETSVENTEFTRARAEPGAGARARARARAGARAGSGAGDGADDDDIGAYVEREQKTPRQTLNAATSTRSLVSQASTAGGDESEVQDCILPLIDLMRNKQVFDTLCLKLEPLSDRSPDVTIFGATLHILGYSTDRVDHVIWAKRDDLRNSPARVLLCMMMQAGKKASHLVRYFANRRHPHQEIVDNLKAAHPGCPVCQHYR